MLNENSRAEYDEAERSAADSQRRTDQIDKWDRNSNPNSPEEQGAKDLFEIKREQIVERREAALAKMEQIKNANHAEGLLLNEMYDSLLNEAVEAQKKADAAFKKLTEFETDRLGMNRE